MNQQIIWQGTNIDLRNINLQDTNFILKWENNPENWSVSQTTRAYSEEEIVDFIVEHTLQIISQTTDIRFMITLKNNTPIGLIDLTSIDRNRKNAEVGIIIAEEQHRKKGYASQAIEGIKYIAKNKLHLETLTCAIQQHNTASKGLFKKANFQKKQKKTTDHTIISYYTFEINTH